MPFIEDSLENWKWIEQNFQFPTGLLGLGTVEKQCETTLTKDRSYLWEFQVFESETTSFNLFGIASADNEVLLLVGFDGREEYIVGLLFDGFNGTLTVYKNGECLGITYTGLKDIEPFHPILCHSSQVTMFRASVEVSSLQALCRAVVLKHIKSEEDLQGLEVPWLIKQFIAEKMNEIPTVVNLKYSSLPNALHIMLIRF